MEEPKIMFASASTAELTVEAISCTSCNVASPSEATLITVTSQMFWREIVQGGKKDTHTFGPANLHILQKRIMQCLFSCALCSSSSCKKYSEQEQKYILQPQPSASPVPIKDLPMSVMMVRTSAKSKLINPGFTRTSVTPLIP